MTEFKSVRADLKAAIRKLDIVESWIFEFHAVAAGEPATEQYLRYAKTCDLFLLLVGEQDSPATEKEYETAYADNPAKVLPLLVGDGSSANAEFEGLLRSRHTAPRIGDDEVIPRAVDAISEAITGGSVVLPGLRERLDRHIQRLLQVASDEPRICFIPRAAISSADDTEDTVPFGALDRFVLSGPSGGGKSYGLGIWLWARSDTQLPLSLRARPGATDILGLIAEAFDSVKFNPGAEGIVRYAREGQLAVALDGHDDLGSTDRDAFIASATAFVDRFPRCSIAMAVRSLPNAVLPELRRASITALTSTAVSAAFEAYGTTIRVPYDIPAQFRDLAERPLWALLLAQHGTGADSGAVLLQELVQHRLRTAFPDDPIRQSVVAAATGALAWRIRPAISVGVEEALRAITEWAATARDQFTAQPAEETLGAAARTGLFYLEDGQARFSHVLLATALAATWVQRLPNLPPLQSTDRDLKALVAATLPENRMEDASALLSGDMYSTAMALRLSSRGSRSGDPAQDVDAYIAALDALGYVGLTEDRPLVARGPTWLAIADSGTPGVTAVDDSTFRAWTDPATGTRRYTMWTSDPFADTAPLWLACGEALRRFKEQVRAVDPAGDQFDRLDASAVERLVRRPDQLRDRVLASARKWATVRNALIDRLPPSTAGFPAAWVGEPWVKLRKGAHEHWAEVSWGHEEARFTTDDEEPEYRGLDLAMLLAPDPAGRIYRDIISEIESALGAPIESEAEADPSPVPAMSWA